MRLIFAILAISIACVTFGQDPTSTNPNNAGANVHLSWNDDIPRIRYGGNGPGAANGFQIQGPQDQIKFTVLNNGNVGIGTQFPDVKLSINQTSGLSTIAEFRTPDGAVHIAASGSNTQNPTYGNYIASRNSENTSYEDLGLKTAPGVPQLLVKTNGNVGIGSTNPDEKLTVKGKIHTQEVRVDLSVSGPDYVFEEDYDLTSLEEIEAFIQSEKHLPEVPSAKEMEANGVQLGEMNMLLLKKIEELTLYMIEMKKEIEALKEENKALRR